MDPKIYLAPLRGVTDYTYREAYFQHFVGVDAVVAPFVTSVIGSKVKRSLLKDLLPQNNPAMRPIPQILSKSADQFVTMANALAELGYTTVNWNLGCPYPMVARKRRGSGLLPFPERIDAFLAAVMPQIDLTLSVKVRLGRHSADEIFQLLPVFNRYPLEEIIIHPRTGVQMYSGEVDLERFEACLDRTDHRVVYNGDITDLDRFLRLHDRWPQVHGWMIGRGLVANPFLPEIIKAGGDRVPHKVATFKRFHDTLFRRYETLLFGPSHLVQRMKGLWKYFHKPFKDSNKVLKKIHKSKNPQRFLEITERFFQEEAIWNL
jgi:tRNA-dihydrouridine synthase